MLATIVLVLVVYMVAFGALKLAMRLLGWTLRMAVRIALLPLWVVLAVLRGAAFAFGALIPFALIAFLVGLLFSES
jgi:hypothetical protein